MSTYKTRPWRGTLAQSLAQERNAEKEWRDMLRAFGRLAVNVMHDEFIVDTAEFGYDPYNHKGGNL